MLLMDDTILWIEQAKNGQRGSFELLIRQFSRIVYARNFLMLRDRHEAEDLTQETFFKAWNKLSSLKNDKTFKAWLLTIARNLCLDHIKKKKVVFEVVKDEHESPLPAPDHELYQQHIQKEILDNIDKLDEKYRDPLMLRYLEGMNYKQIRKVTGLEESVLKGLLNRGLKKLRIKLETLYNETQNKGNLHEEV